MTEELKQQGGTNNLDDKKGNDDLQNKDKKEDILTLSQEELNKKIQSESDKRVNQALENAKAKMREQVLADLEAEKIEKEKQSKMTDSEIAKAELEKEKAKIAKQMAELALEKSKMTVQAQLQAEGINPEFAVYLVDTDEDKTAENIEKFKTLWQTSLQKSVDFKLGQTNPQINQSTGQATLTKDDFKAMSFTQKLKLKQDNPDLYYSLR